MKSNRLVIIALLMVLVGLMIATTIVSCQEASDTTIIAEDSSGQSGEQQGGDSDSADTLSPGDAEDSDTTDIPVDINVGRGGNTRDVNSLRGFNILHEHLDCKPSSKMLLACSKCAEKVLSFDRNGCLVCSCN